MKLRTATVALAAENPTLRPALLRLLEAASIPKPGDRVKVKSRTLSKDPELLVLGVREVFTKLGTKPFVAQVRVVEDGGEATEQPRWVWLWNIVGYPDAPKNSRDFVDDAMKEVVKALKGVAKELHRESSPRKGERTLAPKPLSRTPVSYQEVIRLLDSDPKLKNKKDWGGRVIYEVEVQTSEDDTTTFYVKVHSANGEALSSIDISSLNLR